VAHAPGRVNLIGDHTDYTGGLVLPMAIDLATVVELEVREMLGAAAQERLVIELTSTADPTPARVVPGTTNRAGGWTRYIAAVVDEVRPGFAARGRVRSTLPIGEGLSSSAALEGAEALALGFEGSPLDLAQLTQRAEHRAVGVPCGIMDQLTCVAGVEGHALRIDCTTLVVEPIEIPATMAVWIVPSGEPRALATSAYAERRAACTAAEAIVGPLAVATVADLAALSDPMLRQRARHVVTENARVRWAAEALRSGDVESFGRAMGESHRSLRDDFAVSTPALDRTVARLVATPGVYGARLTGAGFGGSVVATADPTVRLPGATRVRPSAGATVRLV
jgi:galactokinase